MPPFVEGPTFTYHPTERRRRPMYLPTQNPESLRKSNQGGGQLKVSSVRRCAARTVAGEASYRIGRSAMRGFQRLRGTRDGPRLRRIDEIPGRESLLSIYRERKSNRQEAIMMPDVCPHNLLASTELPEESELAVSCITFSQRPLVQLQLWLQQSNVRLAACSSITPRSILRNEQYHNQLLRHAVADRFRECVADGRSEAPCSAHTPALGTASPAFRMRRFT
jgi:hypothetical protein